LRDLLTQIKARFDGLSRRSLMLGSAGVATLGLLALSRPTKDGGPVDPYFEKLGAAVTSAGLARPTLVIDLARLDQNIAAMKSHLRPGMGYRIVAKSLPSLPLIRHVMAAADTNRLMLFHQPFVNLVAMEEPGADVLLGKPMPVKAAARFYDELGTTSFNPAKQLQWLIDTPERLQEYQALAGARGQSMRINLELDVGLHRGGLTDPAGLKAILETIDADPLLTFSGFMGYDPHLASVPDLMGWQGRAIDTSMHIYKSFIAAAAEHYGEDWKPEELTLNTAGSPTYQLHKQTMHANEVAVGSALVKPTHFDTPTLADHVPASFITTPVVKTTDRTDIPGLEGLTAPTRLWDRNTAQTFFIYGGNWLAEPVSPPGLRTNGVFGRSSNQEMLNGSDLIALSPNDTVVLRPTQSEFVFLQFGNIAVLDGGEITESWPVFTQGA